MANIKIDLAMIGKAKAQEIGANMVGEPTENRVVILSPTDIEKRTDSGLYIPGTAKEGIPMKGVIVKMGPITDEYKTYHYQLEIGKKVTYGMYAGKEIDPNFINPVEAEGKYTILALNEILFVEPNNK